MKISIIGCGYVGCVTGVCFAESGHEVALVDIDPAKVSAIRAGHSPVYEPGLEELIRKNYNRISATTDLQRAVKSTDITFVAVGTPSKDDGAIDLRYVLAASEEIGHALKEKNNFYVVVIKSTVFPGTTEERVRPVLEKASGKKAGSDFGLCANPEFLREGSAIQDALSPDRIVVGADDSWTAGIIRGLYAPIETNILVTSVKAAEMDKNMQTMRSSPQRSALRMR